MRRGWAARGLLGGALLAGSWYGLRHAGVQRADVRAGDVLRRAGSPAADRVVTATTDLGSLYAVVAIAGTLAATGRRRTAADVLALGSLAWAVAQRSKTRVRRARPYEFDGVRRLIRPPTGSSFPSGHAAVAGAVMGLLAERAGGGAGRALLHGASAYVAASRVYVGVHYPTDVVGGVGMGLVLSAAWRGPVAAAGREVVGAVARAAGLGRPRRALRETTPAAAPPAEPDASGPALASSPRRVTATG